MKVIPVPAPDAKVGLKIDYLAKRLAAALGPFGFTRQTRTLMLAAGEGPERHWCFVNLQAGERNEGTRGEFYVNLSVQFPAIDRITGQLERQAWRLEKIDEPDWVRGQLRERLESLLHRQSPEHPLAKSGIQIRNGTDLPALADALERAVQEVGWPWLQAHASLQAVRDGDRPLMGGDPTTRIAAALAVGDTAAAQELVGRHAKDWIHVNAKDLADLHRWLSELGLDASPVPTQPTPRPPDRYEQRLQREAAAEDQAHARVAGALLARADADHEDLHALALAWLSEYRSRWRSDPKPLIDLPAGQRVAALDSASRERVLLALLAHLVEREAQADRDPLHAGEKAFDLDGPIADLLRALLPTLAEPGAENTAAVVGSITALMPRLKQELITAGYPWGFAALVDWTIAIGTPHRAQLSAAVQRCLDALADAIITHHERIDAALAIEDAKPLDPNDPSYELLLEAREMSQRLRTESAKSALQRRLREYPEQALGADDRRAVAAWRRWLRRDAQTGALPVQLEPDDWGAPFNEAWNELPMPLRQAATPILQPWLEGIDGKPSAKWLKALKAQIAALDPTHADAWRAFVLQRLAAFEHSSGTTEWATTGARPGVGARLGESSQAVLLGLLWWSACDAGIGPAQRDAAWRRVVDAAWVHLPEVGARAATAGTLALRLLAGLGGAARERVAELARPQKAASAAKGAKAPPGALSKQSAKAAEKALADPLAP